MRHTSSIFTRTVCLSAALAASFAVGCTAPSDAPAGHVDVTSDESQGLLARVAFEDGGYVDFLRAEEGTVLIAGVFDRAGPDPLRGLHLSEVLPSELFSYLTGRAAPEALRESERGLASNPEAFASLGTQEGDGDLGRTTQALSGDDFFALYCHPRIDFCGLDLTGSRTLKSDGRVDQVEGDLNVLTGNARARIRRNRLVGGDETLATYAVGPDTVIHIGAATPGLDRKMTIVVDQADSATYHLAANFYD